MKGSTATVIVTNRCFKIGLCKPSFAVNNFYLFLAAGLWSKYLFLCFRRYVCLMLSWPLFVSCQIYKKFRFDFVHTHVLYHPLYVHNTHICSSECAHLRKFVPNKNEILFLDYAVCVKIFQCLPTTSSTPNRLCYACSFFLLLLDEQARVLFILHPIKIQLKNIQVTFPPLTFHSPKMIMYVFNNSRAINDDSESIFLTEKRTDIEIT